MVFPWVHYIYAPLSVQHLFPYHDSTALVAFLSVISFAAQLEKKSVNQMENPHGKKVTSLFLFTLFVLGTYG